MGVKEHKITGGRNLSRDMQRCMQYARETKGIDIYS